MTLDEGSIYMLKSSIIYKAIFSDSYVSQGALKPFDGKSQTMGCAATGASFCGDNYIYFPTLDNSILQLGRYEDIDYPQTDNISNIINSTINDYNLNESKGIVFDNIAYISCKADFSVSFNNVVLQWDVQDQFWHSPIVGWNANDFALYDEELYFSNSAGTNIYKITDTPTDDIYGVEANWRSKQFNFGDPTEQKVLKNFYIEGYVSDDTTLTITLFFDENGATQTLTTDFLGTENDFIYNAPILGNSFNTFGENSFGEERFGSNNNISTNKKFRIYFDKNLRDKPFYNLQVDLTSNGVNNQWSVTRFGFDVEKYSQGLFRRIMRAFK